MIEHHSIAKKQSLFLRVKGAPLKFDEAVLILDFAENYSFIIQVCSQSYHCNNAQATIHSFALYIIWMPRQKKLALLCFHASVIIWHCCHNIVTANAYVSTLKNDHIKTRYPFLKSIWVKILVIVPQPNIKTIRTLQIC